MPVPGERRVRLAVPAGFAVDAAADRLRALACRSRIIFWASGSFLSNRMDSVYLPFFGSVSNRCGKFAIPGTVTSSGVPPAGSGQPSMGSFPIMVGRPTMVAVRRFPSASGMRPRLTRGCFPAGSPRPGCPARRCAPSSAPARRTGAAYAPSANGMESPAHRAPASWASRRACSPSPRSASDSIRSFKPQARASSSTPRARPPPAGRRGRDHVPRAAGPHGRERARIPLRQAARPVRPVVPVHAHSSSFRSSSRMLCARPSGHA